MSNELIQTIVYGVLIPILPILTAYVVQVLKAKTTEVKGKINNNTVNQYVDIAENAVETAVAAVNQIFVDSLKKAGTFDAASQKKAFEDAKVKAIAIMGDAAKNTIETTYGNLNAWLDNKIEYYIGKNK